MSATISVESTTDIRARRRELRSVAARNTLRALGRSLTTAVISLVVILVVWLAVVKLFGVSPYITQTPLQVWNFLFTLPSAGDNRALVASQLQVTLVHSLFGFAVGIVVAILIAIAFRLSATVESAFMPFALLLRSVPLLALAPIIFLVFGIGSQASVGIIGGIVVLFPALVNIAFGLKNSSQQMLDVVHVFGGSNLTIVRKVALPAALPSLFAAIRISIPGAITGALLAEWLSTGDGIGGAANKEITLGDFPTLWASSVIITIVSLLLYMIVQAIEAAVLARMGMGKDD
jgi:ABC-type nitrate/sulfonate/bicarbonate transport system permease component